MTLERKYVDDLNERPAGVMVSTLGSQPRCSGLKSQAGEDKIGLCS